MTCSGVFMAKTDQARHLVVCDAGPLIHLDEIGCLDLLSDFAEVLVPDAVWEEVGKHRPEAMAKARVVFRRTNPRNPAPANLEALAQIFSLHRGEWEALRVALEHPSGILLSDDTAARLAAANLDIRTHGTVGILVRAIRRNQRTKREILLILKSLPSRSTLHLKPSLLDRVISEVEGAAE